MRGWIGKIIGISLGLLLTGNVVGIALGLFIGHLYDSGAMGRRWSLFARSSGSKRRATQGSVQGTFFNTSFLVMGYVAKSDGRVSENEIRQARHVMRQMSLDEAMKLEAIRLFNEGKSAQFNLQIALERLKQACVFQPSLLRVFLDMQVQMACADGQLLTLHKRYVLETMSRYLGATNYRFEQFNSERADQQSNQRQYNYRRPSPQNILPDAYKLLGLQPSATPSEIKKAYRRLMSQHHPDKLIAKGVPPEMIKMATKKTQRIKAAYEAIKKARGF